MCSPVPSVRYTDALYRDLIVENKDVPPGVIVAVQHGKPVAAVEVAPPPTPRVIEDARPDRFTQARVTALLAILAVLVVCGVHL